MLIQALCDYYDVLAAEGGKLPPEGYSEQAVHYCISLTAEGKIDAIIDCRETIEVPQKNGKMKQKKVPTTVLLPERIETTTVAANIVEHRPVYIFGLLPAADGFTARDSTNRAQKSHTDFVEKNLAFIDGLDSPLICAYRAFLQKWNPQAELENPFLMSIQSQLKKSVYFQFCLSGRPDLLLQDDAQIQEKWKAQTASAEDKSEEDTEEIIRQCAVTGEAAPIARIHNKIKGVYGGPTTGSVFIGFKTSAGCSYGNEQSYNSNVSEAAMKKYTASLNALLCDPRHKQLLDDITVVYWAKGNEKQQKSADLMSALIFGDESTLGEAKTNEMLDALLKRAKAGAITDEHRNALQDIDENVDFYILGLKPNASRVSLKFFYHKRFGEILQNIAQHQNDLQIGDTAQIIPMWKIKAQLLPPESKTDSIDPSLAAAIFKAVIYGGAYPNYLLATVVRRCKTDKKTDKNTNLVRAGIIKACLNRQARLRNQKEEFHLSLDTENTNQAYLCGRLFATLEKIQQDALGGKKLNRSIKDAYFASATAKPATVFPQLMKLTQAHLKNVRKISEANYISRSKLIQEIVSKLQGEFPNTLLLAEQGKFIVGYYQQYDSFFKTKNTNTENTEETENA